jgi:hypothetical protein
LPWEHASLDEVVQVDRANEGFTRSRSVWLDSIVARARLLRALGYLLGVCLVRYPEVIRSSVLTAKRNEQMFASRQGTNLLTLLWGIFKLLQFLFCARLDRALTLLIICRI